MITLKLPLTLSILKAILIGVEDQIYAIPISFVNELITVSHQDLKDIGPYNAITLRGDIIPVAQMKELLGYTSKECVEYKVIVINRDPSKFGLVVDEVIGIQEIVMKNLDENLRGIPGISNVTILGDGQVIFVVDPVNLFKEKQENTKLI